MIVNLFCTIKQMNTKTENKTQTIHKCAIKMRIRKRRRRKKPQKRHQFEWDKKSIFNIQRKKK